MIIDWRDGVTPCSPMLELFDADGNQIRRVFWLNTETGESVRLKVDKDGEPAIDDDYGIVEEEYRFPVPIRAVFTELISFSRPVNEMAREIAARVNAVS